LIPFQRVKSGGKMDPGTGTDYENFAITALFVFVNGIGWCALCAQLRHAE
jgi:hypothetical protein